ncbi:MAG TPA: amidohydrolase family protein [Thermoanaerobaculia bacterium]|nr:amidohydrolase family protein [Thermoanaerobaculia bacterium]
MIRLLVPLVLALELSAQTYALRGTLVTPDVVIENGVLLVRDGVIADAGASVAIPDGAEVIDTKGFIYPGLIDLHNHLTWNVHPRWSAGTQTKTRYEWQAMAAYAVGLAGPQSKVRGQAPCDIERFAEVKALVWGATSTVGSLYEPCSRGLARNLDYYSGLFGNEVNKEPLQYRIFPLELREEDEQSVRQALAADQPVVAHLSEGIDANAAREFRMARAHGFLTKGFVIIHGVPLLEKDFEELGKSGVGFVWSPRTNIELYGKTADIAAAKKHVTAAIAPDWSPSGSNGMIEEMRYAAIWADQQFPKPLTPKELVQMATTNPARLARIDSKVGRLEKGLKADYVVVRRGTRDAYSSLIYAPHEDVLLVAVNGRPLYGDPAMMKSVNPSAPVETLTLCGATKAVDMSDSDDGKGISFADTMKNLRAAFHAFDLPMAGLAECK